MFAVVNINKPKDWTSNDVVQKIKHSLQLKKEKVGHLGTLDPFATGVLPITLGKATRLFDYFLKKDKEYVCYIEFGVETDTLDIDGKITQAKPLKINEKEVKKILPRFIGKQMQMPPHFSAKKVNGKKAYDLAREGKSVELTPKEIEIHGLELLEKNAKCMQEIAKNSKKYDKNVNFDNIFAIKVTCSSGTYIRSFARDLANSLGTVANVCFLERTKAGVFTLDKSTDLSVFLDNPNKFFMTAEQVLVGQETMSISRTILQDLLNGKKVQVEQSDKENLLCKCEDKIVGLCEVKDKIIKIKTFLFDEGDKDGNANS